jgi:putative tricarboxylic transport membrane protein
MPEAFQGLWAGLAGALSGINPLLCFTGVMIGMVIGVLPGLGPAATMSLLLPITFHLNLVGALIMMAGVYYGAMYGGSITSILVRIPGEAASVITCIDGYALAKKGRAGAALGLSAIGSFIAGILATLGIALLGPTVAVAAQKFGPAEYASLVLVGLVLAIWVSQTPPLRSLIMVMLGLLLATVGLDPIWGTDRYTFAKPELFDGISMPVLAMGLFGIAEVLLVAERTRAVNDLLSVDYRLSHLLPNREEWREGAPAIGRGSVIGFLLGILPGSGAVLAAFASYVVEKRISKHPEMFGHGAPAGVAGPEAANNAAAQSSFIPLLCLGIPSNVVMAIMMGALMIHGVTPGPRLMTEHSGLFWAVIASMLVGNVLLIILNLPLISIFVRMLKVPFAVMAPTVIVFCIIGAYSIRYNFYDVVFLVLAGIVGYGLKKVRLDPAPLVLGFVLGDILEKSIRQALILGGGSAATFVERPISATLLALAVTLLAIQLLAPLFEAKRRRNNGQVGVVRTRS